MTSLIISDRNNVPLSWGRAGHDIFNLEKVRESWTRKTVINSGFYDGVLTLTDETDIVEFFNKGLGYIVREKNFTDIKWEGFVYEMVLHGNVDNIRSYDSIYNSVSAQAGNYINNGGFETGTFANWTRTGTNATTDITITAVEEEIGRGVYSVKTTNVTFTTTLSQSFDCSENTTYRLSFYHWDSTDDTTQARYRVADNIGDIIPVVSIENNEGGYKKYEVDFITHSGATSCTIYLYNSATTGKDIFYDDVKVQRLVGGDPVRGVTAVTESNESVVRYGRKSKVLDSSEELAEAESVRDTFLSYNAFPTIQRGNVSFSEPSLDIYVRGYIETLDWNLWTLDTGGSKQTAIAILDHIKANNEFIDNVIVEGSPPSTFCLDPHLVTQEDAVKTLMAQLGDNWQIGMIGNRTLILQPISFTPKYYMKEGSLYPTSNSSLVGINAINERDIVPAVVRDTDSLLVGVDFDSAYESQQDFIMGSVEVGFDNISFGSNNVGRVKPINIRTIE